MKDTNNINKEIVSLFSEFNLTIPNIDIGRNYWLVRTNGGENYKEFINDNFIAINWDENVNNSKLKEYNEYKIKDKQQTFQRNNSYRFYNEMKIGDVILITSKDSKNITFAEITSDTYQYNVNNKNTTFTKRKNIRLLKTANKNDLDLKIVNKLNSTNTISNLNSCARIIDSTFNKFYVKGKNVFYSITVNNEDEISAESIKTLTSIPWIASMYFKTSDYDLSNLTSTICIQSPGMQQFKSNNLKGAKSLILLGIVTHMLFGGTLGSESFNSSTKGFIGSYIEVEKLNLEKKKEENRHKEEILKLKLKNNITVPNINEYTKDNN